MEFKFYGVRGSCPTPITREEYKSKVLEVIRVGRETLSKNGEQLSDEEIFDRLPSYLQQNIGGNTTCLSVTSKLGNRYIFDMGTGLRVLGNELASVLFSEEEDLNLRIFMTHTHWDHIQGWPFFKPAYSPKTNIEFYSCIPNLKARLELQQNEENFPVSFDMMASQKSFHNLEEYKEIEIEEFKITPFPLKHPGTCTGYRIAEGDQAILFTTDVEFREDEPYLLDKIYNKVGKASILIIDAQYSSDEADMKLGWGHTSVKMAVKAGERLGVKKVFLTHFEPDHTDAVIREIIQTDLKDYNPKVEIILAREGLSFSMD